MAINTEVSRRCVMFLADLSKISQTAVESPLRNFLEGSYELSRALLISLALIALTGVVLYLSAGDRLAGNRLAENPPSPSPPATPPAATPSRDTPPSESAEVSTVSATPTVVGREVCAECHKENFDLHAKHGHASTFHFASESEIAKNFVGKTFDGGEKYGTYHYHADDQGQIFATLPDKFGEDPFPLQIALGSGHNAITFLSLLPNPEQGTSGVEHRVSWYTTDGTLKMTPGHANKTPRDGAEFFGDVSQGEALERCIYCHTTTAKVVNQKVDDLTPGVGCEKCHGPGSEHVREARASLTPPPFSVGLADWDTESELQLCGDCHRLPKSISEKELREYPELLMRFQPIGLLRSRCYLESEGKLRCTTCHSPHTSLQAATMDQHVQNCVNCHQDGTESHVVCPVSPKDGCIECHMPPMVQEQGLRFHDHWIRVREDD